MRKLALVAALSFFSVVAFSQEALQSRIPSVEVESSPAPTNTVESAANSVGKWLGQLAQTPVAVAKSLASGIKTGYSGPSNTPAAVAPVEAPTSTKPFSALSSQMEEVLARAQARAKAKLIEKQASAPVEDRSVLTDALAKN